LARQANRFILAFGFVLCIIGLTSNIAQACLPPCESWCNEGSRGVNELKGPHDCCEDVNEASCGVFASCCSKSSALVVSRLSKVEVRQCDTSTINEIQLILTTDFSFKNGSLVQPLATGLRVPLFLKNNSLLC